MEQSNKFIPFWNIIIYDMKINRFCDKLKDIMTANGISQSQLARMIGYKPSAVNKYVNGKLQPDLDTLLHISYVLKSSPDELLGWEELNYIDETGKYELDKYFDKND